MGKTPWRDKEKLQEMYHEKGLEQSEIANRWGCCINTISRWMSRLDVETADHSERNRLQGKFNDETWLREQYIDEKKSIYVIADEQDVSPEMIWERLDEHNIERRKKSDAMENHYGEAKYRNEEFLREKYIEEEMPMAEIAELCEVSISTIEDHLIKNSIPRRSISSALSNYYQENGYVPFIDTEKYHYWYHVYESQRSHVAVHRLLAVAEYGLDEVVGKDVHHKNRIPWDNRPENIELLSKEEHGRMHSHEYHDI